MVKRASGGTYLNPKHGRVNVLRRAPIARAIALTLAAGGVAGPAHAQQAFSRAWMAQKNMMQDAAAATGRLPNGTPAAALTSPTAQQQRANDQLQQSIRNLGQAAQSIAAMQATQAAARQAAAQESSVPDGLAEGGLKVDTNSLTAGWLNAKNPTQKAADGRTQVTIEQTADKAILNWETFNVGRNTTVQFDQQANWSVLNRVNDPKARPSQIQGQIKADGTVMIVNRNGIVFTGTSQVDTRNLVAAAAGMSDAQFRKGIFSDAQGNGYVPTFANDLVVGATSSTSGNATGDVVVQPGARIQTRAPQSVTEGGGYVLLLGREARNGGTIVTPSGQTVLAAGDSFVIRKGQGTDGNQTSTTRGNEVDVLRNAGSQAGQASNSGLILAETGDVTLVGRLVDQKGVIVSTTSVNTRGTVHLRAVGDAQSLVTLAPGSVTSILLDNSNATALDAQRDALIQASAELAEGGYNRRDLSLVKIDSAGDVAFLGDSLTLATGGQVMVNAARRTDVANRATIDVSGAVGVNVAMESNNVLINAQGNEQRDAPINRDSKNLNNAGLWIDRRTLVRVAAGVDGYATERLYTGGGLLEVSGYLSTVGHSIGEWAAQGGTVSFGGAEVVTHAGSGINVSGGSLNVQSGKIRQTWLRGADGQLYNLATAPADNLYTGVYRGYESTHARWGKNTTENFNSPLIAPSERLENGYTVGRDAGRVIVSTKAAVLEGNIDATVFQGDRQRDAHDGVLDAYHQSQTAVARAGQLVIGQITPVYDSTSNTLRDSPGATVNNVDIGEVQRIAADIARGDALPDALQGRIRLDAHWLNAQHLGGLSVYARDGIVVDGDVQLANGGDLALHATQVDVNANLTARGGSIALGNMVNGYTSAGSGSWLDAPLTPSGANGYTPRVAVGQDVLLDVRGLWSNLKQDATDIGGVPYTNGGTVRISSTGDVLLDKGSVIDVSSGAALLANGKLQGGRGGSISLLSNQFDTGNRNAGTLTMDGELRGYGVNGGGTLTIDSGLGIAIGSGALDTDGVLPADIAAAVNLTLTQRLVLPAGTVLKSDFVYTTNIVPAGQAAPGNPLFTVANPYVLPVAWTVPAGVGGNFAVVDAQGRSYSNGNVVPAGTRLVRSSGEMQPGYVVPANVFPNGMPVADYSVTVAAGTPLSKTITLEAGAQIAAGTRLPEAVSVKPLLHLDTDVFRTGFSRYVVGSQQGVEMAPGAVVDVVMPVLQLDMAAASALATGAEPDGALARWLPPLWQEDAARGKLTQRAGADLTLKAGSLYVQAPVVIGRDATVSVDPGRAITLESNGQVTVDGHLDAWGGNIAVLPGAFGVGNAAISANGAGNAMSIWIGDHAVLDVAGRAATAVDANGHVYGQVGRGGSIEIGARHDLDATKVDAADAFVVIRPGARLDASGASAVLDLPGAGSTAVATDGGVIALSSYRGLFVDGDLRAAAGGQGAAGGTLALNLETPNYGPVDKYSHLGPNANDLVRLPRDIVVAQFQGDSALADDLLPGQRDAALKYGAARIGVDRIQGGGFGNVALLSNGMISFDGDVTLAADQSLRLTASSIGMVDGAPAGSHVRVMVPYIRLAGTTRTQAELYLMPNPVALSGAPGVPHIGAGSSLDVDADLLDLVGSLSFGANGSIARNAGTPLSVQRDAFDQTTLRAAGDMRLYGSAALTTAGNLRLAAAQIYPATGEKVSVTAGLKAVTDQYGVVNTVVDPDRHLDIERVGDALPAEPYSVFGQISFTSATINQGGVVRAPMGNIMLGSTTSSLTSAHINLLPGSVTSVSADGLVMPYGGTLDGLSYLYNGNDVAFSGVGNSPAIAFAGNAVDVREGAVLDLSGGGTLTGAAFLSGRGGSVDARMYPLVQVGAKGGFTLPGLQTNPVYAIVPGVQAPAAPIVGEKGASTPGVGRQITIGAGVPGLPAGTYTLLPSTFALLPGAFRVELNGAPSASRAFDGTVAMRNGSYTTAARLGVAGTEIQDTLPTQVFLTSADRLRTYSQYNETSYAGFALAQAERDGIPRALLERDAKALQFNFQPGGTAAGAASVAPLHFAGTTLFAPAEGGYGGSALMVGTGDNNYEILGAGAAPTAGFSGVSLYAADINAIGAARIGIGGLPVVTFKDLLSGTTQRANVATFSNGAAGIVVRDGAIIEAPEVFLVTRKRNSGIVIEQGGGINALGKGKAAWDSTQGYIYDPGTTSVLAVSNGWLDFLAPTLGTSPDIGAGSIDVGSCAPGANCSHAAKLYSEGTIAAATTKDFTLRDGVRYGTRNLVLAVGAVNAGSDAKLAALAQGGTLPAGLNLNQGILDRLLKGDTSEGAPALENLVLTARDAIRFYDDVELSTIDAATGKSSLQRLVLGTPAIYGAGTADALARIHTDTLVWNGATDAPGQVAAGGAGTGAGRFEIDARRIEFGYGPGSRPDTIHNLGRLILGFSNVALNASDRITANNNGSLAVYQSQGAWDDAIKGYAYTGGNLQLNTPLLTGQAGSVNKITAGGDLRLVAPATGGAPLAGQALADALGAEIALAGNSVTLDGTVGLPSGKLTVTARGDVNLSDRAQLDLAGRKIDFYDVGKYSWGGDVVLESSTGNVRQQAGSHIDVSAVNNRAGKLTALALDAGAGTVALGGTIVGSSSGYYDAGGTMVPFAAGGVDIRAQHIDDFTGLNQRLNAGGLTGIRSFQVKQGDLVVGNEIKAREVNLSVDGGRLTVNGTVDASGEQVGSIRLAARDGVTLGGNALLDAHGAVLRVDSYGQVIEAPNRAVIEIDSGSGTLTLASGARMDLRAGPAANAQSFGTVDLNAPRLGGARGNDVNIDASGPVTIDGARAINVNGFWTYKDAPTGTEATADGRPYQSITQKYLDEKHADSVAFVDGALANGSLMNGKLAGLRTYTDALHLRPGVAIVSASPDGDLHIDGDIDLSRYRYASINPHAQKTGVYGSGEAGSLIVRAGGDLAVFGSVTDGFDTSVLKPTSDDRGWILVAGRAPWGGDVVIPHAGLVTLAEDTFFQSGRTLNYALPMKAMTLRAGTQLATRATLTGDLALPAGTVLGAAVRDAAGNVVYPAGTVLGTATTLRSGMQLDAGNRLPGAARVAAMTWPAGVPLPFPDGAVSDTAGAFNGVVLARALMLDKGAVVPSETVVKLPGGATTVALRPADADGNQGLNLALAPMLAPGSQSWSIRLVSGADTSAADTRAVQPHGTHGNLILADTHYGQATVAVLIPGSGGPGDYVWGPNAWDFGFEPGTPIDLLNDLGVSSDQEMIDWYSPADYPGLWVKVKDGAPPQYTQELKPVSQQLFSVLRTGTGDLDVVSGGDVGMRSLFGVYTAGTQSASMGAAYNLPRAQAYDGTVLGKDGEALAKYVDGGADSLYQAWYPEHGGNVLVRAQGDVTGSTIGTRSTSGARRDALGSYRPHFDTSAVGNWLWRQGTGSAVTGSEGIPAAWWINFGSYVPGAGVAGSNLYDTAPFLVGFTGIGTLGGGNLVLEAGGNAGMTTALSAASGINAIPNSQGLNLAVASTGRVSADAGTLTLTGGGDLDVRIGGGLNAVPEVRGVSSSLNSTVVDLRGAVRLQAGSVGGIEQRFDRIDQKDTRAYDAYTASSAVSLGGPVLVPGDTGVSIDTRGDLVLFGVGDAGRVAVPNNGTPFSANGVNYGGEGWSWFSLWTPATAINLFSAGGNLTPSLAWADDAPRRNQSSTDGRFIMPSVLHAVAASGNLYYGNSALGGVDGGSNRPLQPTTGITLAPSPVDDHFTRSNAGQLEMLAAGSIYAGGYTVTQSGADPTALPSPFNPAFVGATQPTWYGKYKISNVSADGIASSIFLEKMGGNDSEQRFPMFTLTSPSASGYAITGQEPARFYAVDGDIVGLRTGTILYRGTNSATAGKYPTWYEGGGAVAIRAGRDIVNAGTPLGETEQVTSGASGWFLPAPRGTLQDPPAISFASVARGNLIVHRNDDDISVVSAGRDIRGSTFYIAGPGLLEVTAGRDMYLADKGELKSIGAVANVVPGDRTSGAGIAVAAGVGRNGADYAAFAARYLNPDNLADLGRPLADQPGKVAAVYNGKLTLTDWLRAQFGYGGDDTGAPAFLAAKQAELDQAQRSGSANGAARRDLRNEFAQESQLHLVNWLDNRFGNGKRNTLNLRFDAATMDADAFFAALPAEQQRAFLRNVYDAELKASGREYNAVGGPRQGSYLRGREAIATLFPTQDAQGNPVDYAGDLTMFSSARFYLSYDTGAFTTRPKAGVKYMTQAQWLAAGSPVYQTPVAIPQDAGIHTDFGGDINIMTPGGRTLVGVDGGFVPGEGSGVLTQGSGNINIYASDSVLLGQSRVFTTFGGNIMAWSAEGDINAGRGAKSTVVYTPQRRVYDGIGLVSLSPTSPNTGAGIATLNPIPEIPPGDVDLIAPLGTIDAGEAGIRVSGNVNLAALRVVNAENIQVQGKASGIPTVAAVNVGALTNASAAASQAANAAQEAVQRERSAARQALPSIFTVRVLGVGGEGGSQQPAPAQPGSRTGAQVEYDGTSPVQVLGHGKQYTPAVMSLLTDDERAALHKDPT